MKKITKGGVDLVRNYGGSCFIAIDFDGTIVRHRYPTIGAPVPNAFNVMKKLQEKGFHLILLTMRSGNTLDEAVQFCKENGVEFFDVNNNRSDNWSKSRKVFAHFYIDDAAVGCPMIEDDSLEFYPTVDYYVDWMQIAYMFGIGDEILALSLQEK